MINLYEYAKQELKYLTDYDNDVNNRPVVEEFIPEILALFLKFSKSKKTEYLDDVLNTIKSLHNLLPLLPLNDWEDEWFELKTDPIYYQNKRLQSLIKDKDNNPYYLDAIKWKIDDVSWIGSAKTSSGEVIKSMQGVNFPFIPKTFEIDVEKVENSFIIKDESQLTEVFNYYNKINSSEKE